MPKRHLCCEISDLSFSDEQGNHTTIQNKTSAKMSSVPAWLGSSGLRMKNHVVISVDNPAALAGRRVDFVSRFQDALEMPSEPELEVLPSLTTFQGTDGRNRVTGFSIADATAALDGADMSTPITTKVDSSSLSAGQRGCLLSHLRLLDGIRLDAEAEGN